MSDKVLVERNDLIELLELYEGGYLCIDPEVGFGPSYALAQERLERIVHELSKSI